MIPASLKTSTSDARIAANRLNASKSTGPRTREGKARSRANAVKHGLTGAGIALPTEDSAQVERRFVAFQEDMAPSDMLGMVLVKQMALMSVRLERAAKQESAMVAAGVRRASVEFDLARLAEVDRLFDSIASNPGENHRRLLTIPEGIDRLSAALASALDQLKGGQARSWNAQDRDQVEAFFGRRRTFFPVSRTSALMEAVMGNFRWIAASEVAHLAHPDARGGWALGELSQIFEAELARLQALRADIDLDGVEQDRLGAADRALFDAGREATFARKYEAAATRCFHRALRDFRENEANVADLDRDGSTTPHYSTTFETVQAELEPPGDAHAGANLALVHHPEPAEPAIDAGAGTIARTQVAFVAVANLEADIPLDLMPLRAGANGTTAIFQNEPNRDRVLLAPRAGFTDQGGELRADRRLVAERGTDRFINSSGITIGSGVAGVNLFTPDSVLFPG